MRKRGKEFRSAKKKSVKRLSSEDFLKEADKMWQAGPPVRYRSPDSWQQPQN